MLVRTRVFDLCQCRYANLSELAGAMGISVSQVYRVREGKRNINQKFIVGAIKAFPEYKFDDLFYFAPAPSQNRPAETPKSKPAETKNSQQALASFTSAIDEYARHLKSHTIALANLSQAARQLREDAEKTGKLLEHLTRGSDD
jgi:hypothetical protein